MAVVGMLVAWAETPTVTDVTAKQRYPWNGLVDITCKVSGIEADSGGYEFVVVAVDKDTGREYTVSTFSLQHNGEDVPDVCCNGDYSLLWNAREDMGQVVVERMTVRITLEALAVSVGKVQLWEGGPYWADRNIGAKKPEDYGLYFWWGDTKGYRPSGGTFSFNFGSDNPAIYTFGKSESELQRAGWVTSSGALAPSHDAAHVKWGGAWRMPTYQELVDLNNKCDWIVTRRNGVDGAIVRGRGNYNIAYIFIPFVGIGDGTSIQWASDDELYLWSSMPYSSEKHSWALFLYSNGVHNVDSYYRNFFRFAGFSIRPVQ